MNWKFKFKMKNIYIYRMSDPHYHDYGGSMLGQ